MSTKEPTDEQASSVSPPAGPAAGFAIEVDGADAGEMSCRRVRGFRDAFTAAVDPHAEVPPQLVLVAPSPSAASWLARWAEDARCVHRSIRLRCIADGRAVMAVASLASYGYGVETALLVESVAPAFPGAGAIVRSGVHPKEAVDAAFGRPIP